METVHAYIWVFPKHKSLSLLFIERNFLACKLAIATIMSFSEANGTAEELLLVFDIFLTVLASLVIAAGTNSIVWIIKLSICTLMMISLETFKAVVIISFLLLLAFCLCANLLANGTLSIMNALVFLLFAFSSKPLPHDQSDAIKFSSYV